MGFLQVYVPTSTQKHDAKEGDVTTPRQCNFCGNSLAEYRGVLETKPSLATTRDGNTESAQELFFCNYEHQADFHAGKTYKPYA
ncbi:hypothetical protein PKHYL_33860 [Psychrobacter sp. KH172YL61]|nr:hypothetical protein PKHYL_33860 [Psychrobacter sp. KH172YL61]